MKYDVSFNLRPFTVPKFVGILTNDDLPPEEHAFHKSPRTTKFALSELSEEVLLDMCDSFTSSVFDLAGKTNPRPSK